MKKFIYTFLILFFGLASGVGIIRAQESNLIDTYAPIDQDLNEIIQTYRNVYSDYQTKRLLYENTNSFSSEQNYVEAARNLLTVRASTFETYFRKLKLQLSFTPGVDVVTQNSIADRIELEQQFLATHQTTVLNLDNLSDLQLQATSLNNKSRDFDQLSYKILSNISLARLQHIIDRQQALVELMQRKSIEELEGLQSQNRQKGLTELTEVIINNKIALNQLKNELNRFDTSSSASESIYNRILQEAIPIYSRTKFIQQRLVELGQGL